MRKTYRNQPLIPADIQHKLDALERRREEDTLRFPTSPGLEDRHRRARAATMKLREDVRAMSSALEAPPSASYVRSLEDRVVALEKQVAELLRR